MVNENSVKAIAMFNFFALFSSASGSNELERSVFILALVVTAKRVWHVNAHCKMKRDKVEEVKCGNGKCKVILKRVRCSLS